MTPSINFSGTFKAFGPGYDRKYLRPVLTTPHMCKSHISGSNLLKWLFLMILTSTVVCSTVAKADPSPEAALCRYRIEIYCTDKLLQLWDGEDLFRVYPIQIGKGGIGKTRSGDHRTPVGDYEISWMASKKSSKGHRIVDHTSWCANNDFYYGSDGPPLEKLWTKSYGGEEATVMSIDYPNAIDRARGRTGDCIHIHSEKKISEGPLSLSYGCIHLYSEHALELYEIVDVRTPVKILP